MSTWVQSFWIFMNFKHIHTFMRSFWGWLLNQISLGYKLMGCYHAMMYTSSKTDGFLGTHKTGLTRFLIFQWKLLSSATYLRVINGTFNHLLGTEITRVILSRNRVGTENRVLWKVGFKLIPTYHVTHIVHTLSGWTGYIKYCDFIPRIFPRSGFVIE